MEILSITADALSIQSGQELVDRHEKPRSKMAAME